MNTNKLGKIGAGSKLNRKRQANIIETMAKNRSIPKIRMRVAYAGIV